MSIIVPFNGVNYIIPEPGETGWGSNLDAFFVAIGAGSLQKIGGSFLLSNEIDFGASFGLKSLYYKSESANIAATGVIRLANTSDTISFRNAANNADLPLGVNSSNQLTFNGIPVESSALTNSHILVGNASNIATDVAMSGDVFISNTGLTTIQPAVVTGSKIAANTITNTNISSSAAIAYSKLNLSNSIVNADINTAAAIAYSKLNLSLSIVNADINTAAAIALTKLAATTASRALVSDSSGFITVSAVTSTELGYVSGVTSSIQTQLNGKEPTIGVLAIVHGGTNSSAALTGQSIMVASGGAIVQNGPLTADRAMVSASVTGLPAVSVTTTTELSYVSGVTSAIQTQLDGKLNTTGGTLTGDLTFASGKGYFLTDSGTNTVKIIAPTTITSSYTLKMPVAQGGSSQYLTNDGSGNLSWTNAAGTGTVNSGTQYQLAYYATSTNVVNGNSTITTNASGSLNVTSADNVAIHITASNPGSTQGMFIDNTSNTAGSNTRLVLRVAGTSAGNPFMSYLVTGGQAWSTGIDQTDSSKFKITSTTDLSSSAYLTITTAGIASFSGAQTYFADGTASLPSISFSSDTNTGWYSIAGDRIGLATGGVKCVDINTTDAVILGLNLSISATNKLFLDGGSNTYIQESASDTMIFVTGGTTRVTITTALITAALNLTMSKASPVISVADTGTAQAFFKGTSNSGAEQAFFGQERAAGGAIFTNSTAYATVLGNLTTRAVEIHANDTLVVSAKDSGVAIRGTNTNDDAAAGFVGEYIVSSLTTMGNLPSSGTFADVTTISLTAGDWDVTGQTVFNANGATVTDGYATAVSIYANNTTTDHVNGLNVLYGSPTANSNMASTTVVYRVSLSTTTTVHLKVEAPFAGGPPKALGTIRARRIR